MIVLSWPAFRRRGEDASAPVGEVVRRAAERSIHGFDIGVSGVHEHVLAGS